MCERKQMTKNPRHDGRNFPDFNERVKSKARACRKRGNLSKLSGKLTGKLLLSRGIPCK